MKNAHIKLMIWHNIMTFGHNDEKNARNKVVVGHNLKAFGHNEKKNANSKLMIQHNTMMMDDSIITFEYNATMYAPIHHTTEHNIMIFAQSGIM